MMLQRLLHRYYERERNRFERTKNDVEGLQRQVFARLMRTYARNGYGHWSEDYDALPQDLPTPEFASRSQQLEHLWRSDPQTSWEATSGTSGGRKWIPYTQAFRADMNRAAACWLADLGRQHPGIFSGPHYWSLSWLPQELRRQYSNDDTHLLPPWQRWIFRQVMAVPSTLQNLPTSAETWFASLIYLANCERLALLSVWSPTYALRLANDVWERFDEIRSHGELFLRERNLPAPRHRSNWPRHRAPEQVFFQQLWPGLKVLSCWDSATSAPWAGDLRALFPHVALQGKGLWATEGPVTIPIADTKVLCASSHFYEFRCLETQRVMPAWKLEKGQTVQPLLWSANGFYRYPLSDRMAVSGHYGNIPCLDFVGRLSSTDLVGEKIEEPFVADLVARLRQAHPEVRCGGVFAVRKQQKYVLALIGETDRVAIGDEFERGLLQNHHYRLARELGQLRTGHSEVFPTLEALRAHVQAHGGIHGQTKIEVLSQVENWPEL